MRLLTLLLLPLPALAGLPGEGEPVYGVDVRATTDPDTRLPVYMGVGAQAAFPLAEDEGIPDLELRGDLQLSQVPTNEVQVFLEDVGFQDVRYGRARSRLTAMASWGATSRQTGLRLRIGPELLIEGDIGSSKHFGDFSRGGSVYTRSARAGLTGAFGLAIAMGEELDDPLIDLRVGASVLAPLTAGGGGLSTDQRSDFLVVDGRTFRPDQVVGRETRVWGEGTVSVDHLRVGLRLGLHHRARDARLQALVDSPSSNVTVDSFPVDVLGQVTVGVVF